MAGLVAAGAAAAAAVAFAFLTFGRRKKLAIPSLAGKHVFITGASSGIGLAIAKQALLQGAFVTISARNQLKLDKAAQSLVSEAHCDSHSIKVLVADVGDFNAISSAVSEAHSWKPIDVLVCNAGYTKAGYFDEVPVEVHAGQVQTNLMGVIHTVHTALPLMKPLASEKKHSIVIVSSGAGLFLLYGSSVYSATKHALRGLAECLHLELLPYNINVNLVCPGFVDTPLMDQVDKDGEFETMLKTLNRYDPKTMQSPDKLAEVTLDAVKKGSFLVAPKSFFPLVVLTRGMLAPASFARTLLEAFWAPIIRLVSYKLSADIKKEILKNHAVKRQSHAREIAVRRSTN
ncbi:3-dehydrosphinganine reductase TSC10A [Selaginella moellendorffii]|uniref:3-dehydrosphinganine reductase TSC10A n=1 Tax=Selaginella moellendorffii TaxID=88036 RepID=UPI000D1CDC73|nr:3-dehydrosphinganine reductase TSC10A [Selaginella moellendorffii]|eukprot:XP_024534845.1 3-dehydrosphinganine reductase TSC10A [Selaginella moellendorffii]